MNNRQLVLQHNTARYQFKKIAYSQTDVEVVSGKILSPAYCYFSFYNFLNLRTVGIDPATLNKQTNYLKTNTIIHLHTEYYKISPV